MLRAALVAGLGAMLSLAFARFAPSPYWPLGLWGLGGSIGIAAGLLGAAALRKRRERWIPSASLAISILAAGLHLGPLLWIQSQPAGPPQIDLRILLPLAVALGLAIVGLVLAMLALFEVKGWIQLVPPLLAISASLYALTPLLRPLGIQAAHWSAVWLFLLAAIAYSLVALARRTSRFFESE